MDNQASSDKALELVMAALHAVNQLLATQIFSFLTDCLTLEFGMWDWFFKKVILINVFFLV